MPVANNRLSYEEYAQGILQLPSDEQIRLIEMVLAHLQLRLQSPPESQHSKLANLKPRRLICGDPDELITFKVWEWNEQSHLL